VKHFLKDFEIPSSHECRVCRIKDYILTKVNNRYKSTLFY